MLFLGGFPLFLGLWSLIGCRSSPLAATGTVDESQQNKQLYVVDTFRFCRIPILEFILYQRNPDTVLVTTSTLIPIHVLFSLIYVLGLQCSCWKLSGISDVLAVRRILLPVCYFYLYVRTCERSGGNTFTQRSPLDDSDGTTWACVSLCRMTTVLGSWTFLVFILHLYSFSLSVINLWPW